MSGSLLSQISVLEIRADRAELIMTTATELANILVTEFGLSFRLAHRLVGSAADEFSQSGSNQADHWFELVREKAQTAVADRAGQVGSKAVSSSDARRCRDAQDVNRVPQPKGNSKAAQKASRHSKEGR